MLGKPLQNRGDNGCLRQKHCRAQLALLGAIPLSPPPRLFLVAPPLAPDHPRHAATRAHRSFGAGGPADLPPSSPLASCWCALVILPSPRKDVDGSAGAPNIASARSLAPNVADGLRVQAARDLIASGAPPRDLWKGIGHGGATAAAAAAWAALPSLKADASLSTAVVAAQRDLLGHLLGATLSTSLGSLSIHAVRGVFVGRQTPVERAAVADRQMHYGAARAVSFVAFLLSSRSLEEAAQWVLLSMVFLYLHSFLSMAEVRFALLRVSVSPRPSSYASLLLLELSVATVAAALFAALPRTSSIGWLLLVGARISLTLAVVESLHQIIQQLIVLHRASTLSAMPRDIALRVMSAAAAVVKLLARLAAALLLSPLHATLIALRAARAAARAAASAVLPKSDCRDARDRRSPDSAGAIRQDDPIPPEGTGVGAQAPFVRANASPGASPRPSMDAPPQRQAPRAGAAEIWADEDAGLLMAGAAGPGEQDGPNWEASGPFLFYWEVVAESLLLATQLVECMIAWLYCFKGPGGSLRAIGRLLLGLFILVQASSVGNNIYRLVRLVSRYVTSMRNLTQVGAPRSHAPLLHCSRSAVGPRGLHRGPQRRAPGA